MGFIIVSDDGYWNKELGWMKNKNESTVFNDTDYNLPIGNNVKWSYKTRIESKLENN